MSATKHTPGPWQVERDRSISAPTPAGSPVVLSADVIVAKVRSGGCASLDQADANARLIASAPELLDALRRIVALWDHHASAHGDGVASPLHKVARAAIAKATGGDA